MARKAKQDFQSALDNFIKGLYEDGTITRWKAEDRLREQERKLKKLEREEKEIRGILEGLRGKKSA